METGKFRHTIIASLASFFALSLAFAGEDESATPAEEDEVAAMEAAAEDVAMPQAAMEAAAEDVAMSEAAMEETAAMEMEEEEEAEEAE